jgi:hypothetical protein
MREGDVHTSSIVSVAPQVVPRSTVPASQEVNALRTGVEVKMQEKEIENSTSVKQANTIPDECNVETHTTGGNDQDQETIVEGRKEAEGMGSVDNPKELKILTEESTK